MKLAKDQISLFLNRLEENWPDPKTCPVCRNTTWDTIDIVFELKGYESKSQPSTTPTIMPVVPVTCKTCGNTVLFNLISMGVLEKRS
jgi:hypothetical protein